MRFRARLILLFAAAPIGILLHAACGGDDDSGTTTTADAAPPATTTTPPPPPPPPPDAGVRGFELAGQTCTSASQCYRDPDAGDAAPPPAPDAGDAGDAGDGGDAGAPSDAGSGSTGQLPVKGTIHCETKVPNGYCTHECLSDGDCCAVPG